MRRATCAFVFCITAAAAPLHARAGWNETPQIKALYEAAKKEGRVTVWGTHRREVDWIPASFAKLFPGIDVQVFGDNDIATKAIAEARAGRHQVDVYWHSITGQLPVVQRDLTAALDWSMFEVDRRNIAFDGKMVFTSNIVYTIAYNTKGAKQADVPANWAGMLDERLKGKGAASSFLLPRLIGALGIAWGEDKALSFARELTAKGGVLLTRAPRESLLQSGERIYAFGEVDSMVRSWAADGLPVGYAVPEPVVMGQFGAGVMKNAPNPNAARLLAGYLASIDGKRAREQATGQADYGPTADNDLARRLHAGKLQVVFDTPEIMVAKERLYGRAAAILTGQTR